MASAASTPTSTGGMELRSIDGGCVLMDEHRVGRYLARGGVDDRLESIMEIFAPKIAQWKIAQWIDNGDIFCSMCMMLLGKLDTPVNPLI
jgi:hypothetical protein